MSGGVGKGSTFIVKMPLYSEFRKASKDDKTVTEIFGKSPELEIRKRLSPNKSDVDLNLAEAFGVEKRNEFQGLHILLVDDAKMILKVVSRLLIAKGAVVSTAENGKEAIDCVSSCLVPGSTEAPYDLVLMDFVMPVCDGPTSTKKLREIGFAGLIVGVTGNVMEVDIQLFKDCGADDVFPKPLDISQLEEYLSKKRRCEGMQL